MEAVYKSGGATRRPDNEGNLDLDQASIISLKIAPESVASFERRDDDLVLVLRDGREVTVHGFFAAYEDGGRNDLVLEDEAGVLWWGQYHTPWSEFHFTEIEWTDLLPLPLIETHGGALAGLAAIGLAAAAGGSGGGSATPPNLPPEAPSSRHTTPEDQAFSGRVGGTDPDGDPLAYTAGTPPANGTVVVDPDGSYTYTPDPDYHGPDSFTVIVDDGNGGTTTSTVTIEVTPVNDPVFASDDTYTTPEDTPLVLDPLANDRAPDGGLAITGIHGVPLTPGTPQSIAITDDDTPTGTVIGTVEIDAGGTITLVPAPDYYGPIGFDYEIEDADGDTDTASVSIDVTPVNDPPRAVGAIADQDHQDAQAGISLPTAGAFFDIESDTLTYSASSLPRGLTIDPDTGLISGTLHPSASQGGTDGEYSVVVTATDPDGASATQTFAWRVGNPAPIASNDAATTEEDTPVSGNVLTGAGPDDTADIDPDGDELELTQFGVNGASYAAGDAATIAGVGTLRMDADGSYLFTPAADWYGTVPAVTYTVSDGEGGTDTAQLAISVTPVNDAPVIGGGPLSGTVIEAGHDDDGAVMPGVSSVSGELTATDVDNDAADLVWSIVGTPDSTYGSFDFDSATGQWRYTLDNNLQATQELNEGDTVDLAFTVEVSDGSGGTARQTVNITIRGSNDAPVAVADFDDVKESGVQDGGNTAEPGNATASGNVLANDSDVDDGETATLKVDAIAFGATAGVLDTALAGTYGSLVIAADGNYTYTLDDTLATTQALAQGQDGTELFTYTVVDANGATSTSTLSITVAGTNDQPVITSDAAAARGEVIEAGTADPDGIPATGGALTANDVDTDSSMAWTIADLDGTYGTIDIDALTGEWVYTLDNTRDATQALNDGDTATETFIARVTDEFGAFSEQLITIDVRGANDDLQGLGDATIAFPEDPTDGPGGNAWTGTLQDHVEDVDDVIELVSFSVAGTTYDPGQTASIAGVGTLSIEPDGSYVFTPLPHYSGEVPEISYTLAEVDGGQTLTQALHFVITPIADAPEMEPGRIVTTNEDTAVGMGLVLPVVVDGTDHNGAGSGDDPERLGAITLRPDGVGAGDASFSTTVAGNPTTLVPVEGVITIVITDVAGSDVASDRHVTDADLTPAKDEAGGVYYLTASEYQAIVAHPGENSHLNFSVTVGATSYEVDATGAKLEAVTGASATQVVSVDVLAVTDAPGLTLEEPADPVTVGATSLTTTPAAGPDNARITVAINEDTPLVLTNVLRAAFPDADGSESYWYEITGLPPGTVVRIDGVDYTASASGTAAMPADAALTAGATSNPAFTITPPPHYSNDVPVNARITLMARDNDTDSPTANPGIEQVSVDLILRVHAIPDDVELAAPAAAPEDTPIAFLAGLGLVDTDGSESITRVRITALPTEGGAWTLLDHGGNPIGIPGGGDADGGGRELAIGTDPGEYTLEQVRAFTLVPPAHSSLDGSITVYVTTTETGANTESGVALTQEWAHVLPIVVRPAAEEVGTDSNGDGDADVTMNPSHDYASSGREDEWFALGTDTTGAVGGGGFALRADWSNEDADEFTYAVLTPTLSSTNPDDSVNGTMFRYHDGSGWTELTYTGEAIWVPSQYLDSLQVRAPQDVAGTLEISVRAGTVDYDDDADVTTLPLDPPRAGTPGVVDVQVSGSAQLTGIEIAPVADAATLALNGRASGKEDSPIALAIRPSSSDSSEIFDITITGIPEGAILVYDGDPVAVTGGTARIDDFDFTRLTTITPPPHYSGDFTLRVSAQSVDGGDVSMPSVQRTILVSVEGVADTAEVELAATPPTYTEAELDDGVHFVALGDLVELGSPDEDGSEALSVRVTGLAADFSITGATLVTEGNGGDTRVWTAPAESLDTVVIRPPANFSGTVSFLAAGVTTESDGDSHTGASTTVSFSVTPSPEALASNSATLAEDVGTPLDLSIIHQNGDTDETLGDVFIAVDDVATASYTLLLGATSLDDAGLGLAIEDIDGLSYYVIPADQVSALHARGGEHLDGDLGGFRFQYEVIDAGHGAQAADAPVSIIRDGGIFTLTATPVTDAVSLSVTGISGADSTSDETPGDDASPDTATVTAPGSTVTVNLHVESADHDGSEHLIRVVIENVPQGVTVVDGDQAGTGTWVLVRDGSRALPIDDGNGIDLPVAFIIGPDVGSALTETPITMTVHSQDRGDQADPGTAVATDSVTWTLVTELAAGTGFLPPSIDEWRYNDTPATEDASFRLSDMLEARVSVQAPDAPNTFTVFLTDVPEGTTITGMFPTSIDGVPTWTASVTVSPGDDAQEALETLLEGIEITPPADSNSNNNGDTPFGFQAALGASAAGGRSEIETTEMPIPVTPVTDEALIIVDATDVDEGTGGGIEVSIAVSNPRDGAIHGPIVDGLLYVRVDADAGNEGGVLSVAGAEALVPGTVTGVEGIPDGSYYMLDVGAAGGTVDLVYTPAAGESLQPGSVSFHAYAQTLETGAANTVTGSAEGTSTISIINNGVTIHGNAAWSGNEPDDATPGKAIALSGLGVTLNDPDSEGIDAIMLAGVPVGFLVHVGADAASATLAGNAGGDGTGNTWVLSDGGELPAYVAVLPPAHWSGTLGGLQLVVASGEPSLPALTETFDLADLVVSPVANGLTIDSTSAFGREGSTISLNLNAAMQDPLAATAAVADASVETTTLQFTGLGTHAAFSVDGALLGPGDGAPGYDTVTDTYTLAGLSQDDLDKLGFMQAATALTDQDAGTDGIQIGVTAWTVESSGGASSTPVTDTFDLQITAASGTGGADAFIWGGADKPVLNGRGGDDTVMLRIGESVSGNELGSGLQNIERIDLSVAGANEVSSLTLQDVFDMTDARKALSFLGDEQDNISLAGSWTPGDSSGGFTAYSGNVGTNTVTVYIDNTINVSLI